MSDLICGGPLTKKILEEILNDYFKTGATLASCQGEIISRGLGFTSDVMRITLNWSNVESDLVLPEKVIVKAPKTQHIEEIFKNLSVDQKTQIDDKRVASAERMIKLIHEAECNAYKVLMMDPKGSPVPLPLIYCCRIDDPPAIVMEDMGGRAAMVLDIAQGLSLAQWRSVADRLADLHAWSLTTDVPWDQYVGGTETIAKMFSDWMEMASGALKATKAKYTQFADVDEKLYEKEFQFDRMMDNFKKYVEVLPTVMQHGDTWTNNIFFEKNANGQAGDEVAAFIDWQISFAGCGLNDLARVSFMCVDHRLRRAEAYQILKRYYDRFCLKAGSMLITKPTFERVWKIFQHMLAVNGLLGVAIADFLLRFIAHTDDQTDLRHVEVLSRMRAGYDDAIEFMSQPNYDQF